MKIVLSQSLYYTLAWDTAREVDNLGSHLWRSSDAVASYDRINESLVPAQVGAILGACYTYTDTNVFPGTAYAYRLKAIDLRGVSTFHGPVETRVEERYRLYLPLAYR